MNATDRSREWRRRHPDYYRRYRARRTDAQRTRTRITHLEWRHRHPEVWRAQKQRWRVRVRARSAVLVRLPYWDADDVAQEMALAEIEGRDPIRAAIIWRRCERRWRNLTVPLLGSWAA